MFLCLRVLGEMVMRKRDNVQLCRMFVFWIWFLEVRLYGCFAVQTESGSCDVFVDERIVLGHLQMQFVV